MSEFYTSKVRRMALHYRIQRVAADREWDCTTADIADHLDLTLETVRNVCRAKGWTNRLRSMTPDHSAHHEFDHLEGEAA